MKKIILSLASLLICVLTTLGQNANYVFISADVKSPSSVTIMLKTYAQKKKEVDKEAKIAALKIIMFDGLESTIYNDPLLKQGPTAMDENPTYFLDLFTNKLPYYVKLTRMLTEFNKAEQGEKSTLYSVEVNYIQLKKDLERSKITSQLTNSSSQPSIMVIPYVKQGEDLRTILEADANKRVVLTKIKEAFDAKGCSTIDFVAKLKAIESGNVFNMDNQSDIKSQIIDMSGADIYVEAEILCSQKSVSGQQKPESNVKIVITAYDAATGMSLSNKIGESGVFYTDDISRLAVKAIEKCADEFLHVMQEKFTEAKQNGNSVMIQIGVNEYSEINLGAKIGTQSMRLQDEIILWIEEHAYNGAYHLQGVTSTKMIIDNMKIPPMNPLTGGAYSINRFEMDLYKFLTSLGLDCTSDTRGNTIYITIN